MGKNKIFYFYILLFALINYSISEKLLGGNLLLAVLTILTLLFVSFDYRDQRFVTSAPVLLWCGLMSLYLIRDMGCPKDIMFYKTTYGIGVLVLSAYLIYHDESKALFRIILMMSFFCLIGYIYSSMADDNRLRSFMHPNQLAQLSALTSVLTSLFIIIYKKPPIYYLIHVLSFIVILLCGSRNGLLLFIISLFMLLWSYLKTYNIASLCLAAGGGYLFLNFVKKSILYERLFVNETQTMFQTGTILDVIFGDRAIYYYWGFNNFWDNPIFGIGLQNFPSYNNFEFILHSEPMTHLAEGGLIGFLIYCMFIYYFVKEIRSIHNDQKELAQQLAIGLIGVLIVGLTAREYEYPFFFVYFGVINGFAILNRRNKNSSIYRVMKKDEKKNWLKRIENTLTERPT